MVIESNLLGPKPREKSGSHIDASHSRQPLVKGERLVRNEVNAVMLCNAPAELSKEIRKLLTPLWSLASMVLEML